MHFLISSSKKKERASSLLQDIKLFWFMQVLSKNLHGRTIKGVGDNSQPLNKAESNQPEPKVRTPERVSNAGTLENILLLSLILVPDITGLYLPFLW